MRLSAGLDAKHLRSPLPRSPHPGREVALRTGVMVAVFALYVVLILTLPGRGYGSATAPGGQPGTDEPSAFVAGRRAWLASGCQSCHAVYGLGGHLGPDLTNAASRLPIEAIRTTIAHGRAGMPAFKSRLTTAEIDSLIAYLRAVDATGAYPPASGDVRVFGRSRAGVSR